MNEIFCNYYCAKKKKTETKIIDTKMLKNYDFDSLEICFSGIDHHLAPDCCHRNLTENRIWLCITNFLNKQSKSLRKQKSKNSGAAAPLKISREKKNQRSQFDQKTLIL